MSSSGLGNSTVTSSCANKPGGLFEDVWTQLRECHQSALQELETKVSRLKKERCLDAQKLEEFHKRNQQLKEQHKILQDNISLLEDRLRAGACERCAVLEERIRIKQVEFDKDFQQNLCLVTKLKSELSSLQDDNKTLSTEVEKLKASHTDPQVALSPEPEDGVIPDSPVLPSSLPLANKLKRRRKATQDRHVRYAETPPPHRSLLTELRQESLETSKNHGRPDVLVPDTCEMDMSPVPQDVGHNIDEMVAETCALDLPLHVRHNTEMAAGPAKTSTDVKKCKVSLRPQHITTTTTPTSFSSSHYVEREHPGRSPSLLASVRTPSAEGSLHRAKQQEEEEVEVDEDQTFIRAKGDGSDNAPSFREPQSHKAVNRVLQTQIAQMWSVHNGASRQTSDVIFKNPAVNQTNSGKKAGKVNGLLGKKPPRRDANAALDPPATDDSEGKHKVDLVWSVDPALALSMYAQSQKDEEEWPHSQEEPVDTDYTFISHSMLQRQGIADPVEHNSQNRVSVLAQKANDSLDQMFDTTAYGEYKSCTGSRLEHTRHCEDEEEEEWEDDGPLLPGIHEDEQKSRNPTFAHVAVIRKKDERRKLKGSTCKECDIYYAHLPEEEREKKLSACSRHRFLYVPPSTPENFWEVGFPSTQTCIERGYIREETSPQARLRRRQPLNALFSPKHEEQNM